MAKLHDSKYCLEDIKEIVEIYGYKFLGNEYKNTYTKFLISDKNGYLYFINFNKFYESIIKNNLGICKFGKRNPYTIDNIKNWLLINNKPFNLISEEFSYSFEKLIFNCNKCNNNFDMTWDNISRNQNCPYCAKNGKRVSKRNSFYENYAELTLEWDYEKNKDVDIKKISYGSEIKIWWKCPVCLFEYRQAVNTRTCGGEGCPRCANKVVSDRNRLSNLFPDISSEWSYGKNKKTPFDYAYASNKKVWWKCPICSNNYLSRISNRTLKKQGCIFCNMSVPAQYIYSFLKNRNIFFKEEFWFNDLRSDLNTFLKFDFCILDENFEPLGLIEFDGIQHEKFIPFIHKTRNAFERSKKHDIIKNNYAEIHNIPLLRIKDNQKLNMDDVINDFLISIFDKRKSLMR